MTMINNSAVTISDSPQRGSLVPGYTVRKRTKFPSVCVKCGAKEGLIARRRTFAYIPYAIYVAFLFGCVGMVLGVFLCLVGRKTIVLAIPTCSRCAIAWDQAARRPIFFFVGSLVATLAGAGLVWNLDAGRLWLPLGAGVLLMSIGPIALHFRGRQNKLWVNSLDETSATLMGLHPAVIAELEARRARRQRSTS